MGTEPDAAGLRPSPSPTVLARRLIDRAAELAAGLEFGEARLLDRRVALISRDDDFLLGRLLNCYGARVVCVFAQPRSWQPELHGAVLRSLLDILEKDQPGLSRLPLERWRDHGFAPDDDWQLAEPSTAGESGPFDIVFALDILPGQPGAALAELERVAELAGLGGAIELLQLLPDATIRHLRENAGLIRLGLRGNTPGTLTDDGRRRVWLSFVRLSGPLHDYPVEGRDHPGVLAHCRARLDFAADFVAGADVLEAGAATGIGARLFLDRGARQVVCLDRVAEALELGQRRTTDSRIRFVQGDLDQPLPFADASFDVIVCLEVLEHITAQPTAVAEFHRLLRPGGRLIVSVPDPDCEDGWAEVNRFRNPYHLCVIDRGSFLALLQGFERIELARQTEVVGAVVTGIDDPHPAGDFVLDAPEATTGLGMVQIAVCTKAPVEAARPVVCRPRLRVYENYSARHLLLAQQYRNLNRELVHVRHDFWQRQNRQRRDWDRQRAEERQALQDTTEQLVKQREESFRLEVELLARCGGVVVSRMPLEPGRWSQLMEEVLHPLDGTVVINPPSGSSPFLALHIGGDGVRLAPVDREDFHAYAVAFPVPRARVGLLALRRWLPHFVQEFWFLEATGWQRVAAPDAFPWLYRLARFGRAMLGGPLKAGLTRLPFVRQWCRTVATLQLSAPEIPATPQNLRPWQRRIDADNRRAASGPQPASGPLRVTQYIGTLYTGGAERQAVNLSLALHQRGHAVRLLTMLSMVGELGHYERLLTEGNVPTRAAGRQPVRQSIDWRWLQTVPEEIREHAYRLTTELLLDPPDVLHCWMDQANIAGAIAGLLSGVPQIILGFRASNPTHFPPLFKPYLLPWYRLLVASRRIQMIANSHSAAASYSEWIGIPPERIHVVRNGIRPEQFRPPTAAQRRAARCAFGLEPEHRVICGVFRLSAEKQPGLFLRVVRSVAERLDRVRVLLAGIGPLEDEVRSQVKRHEMTYVDLLGRYDDVQQVLLASDALLLTSAQDSCPNVVMEAQFMGVPVVATTAGGIPEIVSPNQTAFLTSPDDADGLADHLAALLSDADLHLRCSRLAPSFAARAFDLDTMVEHTLDVYRRTTPDGRTGRIVSPRVSDDIRPAHAAAAECESEVA